MRVLVTGATGFVGQHLLRQLALRGHTIFGTCLGKQESEPSAAAEFLACDMREPAQVAEVVRHALPQHIYHLAGLSSVTRSFSECRRVWDTNLGGAMNLLDAVRETVPKARVLLVGSGQCYGSVPGKGLPISEEETLSPESPYAGSKAAADLLAYQYFRSWNLQVIRARPFNHTGPGQPPQFLCSDLARQVAEIDTGLRPPVLQVGNTRVQRDFSDVRDVVRAYELLLERGEAGAAYNVASGQSISVAQVICQLRTFCSREFRVEVQATRLRQGEPLRLYGSYRKLRRATGWRPEYAFCQTLKDVYSYWKWRCLPGQHTPAIEACDRRVQ